MVADGEIENASVMSNGQNLKRYTRNISAEIIRCKFGELGNRNHQVDELSRSTASGPEEISPSSFSRMVAKFLHWKQ